MKLNRWTAALAAAGIVTVPSLLHAQTNTILTALSSTTLSGYVDTSAQWNMGTGNANNPPYAFGGPTKADGFNLNVVDIALDKPMDEGQWSAGYHVDLWFGPDANSLGTQSTTAAGAGDLAIRQAYVTLRTPIGNGIDWKLGVFDTIIGYESFSSPNNPNYSHSYGFSIEPGQHTGLLATYQATSDLSISAGIANTATTSSINNRSRIESLKSYMASVTYTAPTNWGWVSGSTFTAGVVNGSSSNTGEGLPANTQTSAYFGTTLATPLTALKLGASIDYLDVHGAPGVFGGPPEAEDGTMWAWDLYASFQATEKLTLNLRGEYLYVHSEALDGNVDLSDIAGANRIEAITATAQYDLWKNVLSRVEFRWDHIEKGPGFGGTTAGTPNRDNAYMLAANIIYKF
jgi:hypothetical protein